MGIYIYYVFIGIHFVLFLYVSMTSRAIRIFMALMQNIKFKLQFASTLKLGTEYVFQNDRCQISLKQTTFSPTKNLKS